jgi:hypothetical protein
LHRCDFSGFQPEGLKIEGAGVVAKPGVLPYAAFRAEWAFRCLLSLRSQRGDEKRIVMIDSATRRFLSTPWDF